MAMHLTWPVPQRTRIFLRDSTLPRPEITDGYLILSAVELPDLTQSEYVLLELMANALRHNEVITVNNAAEYLRVKSERRRAMLLNAIEGLISKGLISRTSEQELQLLRTLKLKRPRKMRGVFVRWDRHPPVCRPAFS